MYFLVFLMLWYHISNLLKFISLEPYKCIQLYFNYDKIIFSEKPSEKE